MRLLRFVVAVLIVCLAAGAFAQDAKKPSASQAQKEVEKQSPPDVGVKKPAEAVKPQSKDKQPKDAKKSESGKDEEKPKDPMSASTFTGLKLRSIGPAVTSGRVAAIAVNPKNQAQWYIAAASGGVWRTDNAGTTWTPLFDSEGSYSIGAITIDPNDPSVIWVGSGENNAQRSVSYGDGVYKSIDGGKTWKNMGLKRSEHIGRILVDPRNSDVVYVAAQGPLWGPGGDRGLYKTTDGGKNWNKVLEISENTGVSDIAFDPTNPEIIYASAWQRRRHVFTIIAGGPEGGLHKTTDGGKSWTKLTNGLPKDDIGRIGIAVSPVDPNVIYIQVEAANKGGGIFRSTDKGATWTRQNPYDSTAQYYQRIIADPKNVDRFYIMGVYIQTSDDGGKTLKRLPMRSMHVDIHDLYIDPANNNYLISCGDGGVYDSYERGLNWNYRGNLPITQFYDITVDNSKPFYYVYGGTQDNYSLGGPSRTRNINGILNSDWFVTRGGDGFRQQVDPVDPNIVYSSFQYGGLGRFDRSTGEEIGIQPTTGKGEPPLRWNWDSPLIISPHKHTRLYFAANRLFRSDDRGDTWREIGPDLTRQIDRNKLPVMGKVWGVDAVAKSASTSFYGNIVALAESPKKEGLLYVGTDDGLIQVTEDGGKAWTKHERFPGVPEMTYVSRILASQHDSNTVYASFENHKNADFRPYLLKSIDAGRTWISIASNLPENGPVLAIAEDPVNPKLLFAGTEFGLWFTIDGGSKWIQLKGDFPTIAVRDLAIQARESDLAVGTFGRGIYILDDITPLRMLAPEMLKADTMYPAKDTMMYVESRPLGGRRKSFQGEQLYTANNPPFGVKFTYFLKDKLKTKKELRQEAEKAADKKGEVMPYPTAEQLRAETDEQPPVVFVTVYDSQGKAVRNINAPINEGFHRVTWNLRYPTPALPPESSDGDEDMFYLDAASGPMVLPGSYSAKVFKKVDGVITQIGQEQKFRVFVDGESKMTQEQRAELDAFQTKAARLYRAVSGAVKTADEMKSQMKAIRRALVETPTIDGSLVAEIERIDGELNTVLRNLRGDVVLASRNENVPPSIQDRASSILSETRFVLAPPTATHRTDYEVAAAEFTAELAKLRKLAEQDIAGLQKQLETVEAPWTPGRIPVWSEQ